MVTRKLPAEYTGWEQHEPEMRRRSTRELVAEIQDGPPARRLAAMSVVDLAAVEADTVRDWIRTLPEAEANELAGAMPVQRPHAPVAEDRRWAELARFGFERRLLPTFLVVLTASLESIEAKDAGAAEAAWQETGEWLKGLYPNLASDSDAEALKDLSLFIFESFLDRELLFAAFCELLQSHRNLARQVSSNPGIMLMDLGPTMQRQALEAAERGGGLPLADSWRLLHEPSH